MIPSASEQYRVAIACGGTGGHLFPGLAVAGQLARHGAGVTLIVSPKEIDQLALKTASEYDILTLPAIGLTRGRLLSFTRAFVGSYRATLKHFRQKPVQAVLAMGGFTSAPPILAAKRLQAVTFLHESNSVPGRANRWLSWMVERVFIGFPSASRRLHTRKVTVTGTPVGEKFKPLDPSTCRVSLGLDPSRPVVLVMGGSQGAHGINELVLKSLALFAQNEPNWQWFHLAGSADEAKLRQHYAAFGLVAKVYAFFPQMQVAMGAAIAGISRAGASSLAELAAMRLPAMLIPFPSATDHHQFHNARAFEQTGAAYLVEQATAKPEDLHKGLAELMHSETVRERMQAALARWHTPHAADQIAQAILQAVRSRARSYLFPSPIKRDPPPGATKKDDLPKCRSDGRVSFSPRVLSSALNKRFLA
jgi:UDP-N-acetylglucosamine--N-acetylmuramyl-(pentapeptide) pyrophosphoryl-undecaprenol N-acetylglucosamine transferase